MTVARFHLFIEDRERESALFNRCTGADKFCGRAAEDADLVRYGTQIAKCTWYLTHTPGAVADDCANQYWPQADADAWYAAHVPAGAELPHFVIDSSRNGQGPWTPTATYPDPQTWCNPPGRKIGKAPTVETGDPLIHAYLWLKRPGESDGECNGGPKAGAFWLEQAIELAK